MRLFFTSLIWYLNYFLFKIVLLGNRRVLQRFEHLLFKIVPLKLVHPVCSSVIINITAEYYIDGRRGNSYMLQYARAENVYAGNSLADKRERVVVPVRIYSPLRTKKVSICCNYATRFGSRYIRKYTTQEFENVGPGWSDGVLFLEQTDTEVQI